MFRFMSNSVLGKDAEDALVARAAQDDGAAMTELLERYEGLIARAVRHIFRCSPDLWQDARSVAVIAFIQAVRDYEAAPQSHFAALARSRVRTALVDMLRHERHEAEHAAVHPEQMELDGDCWELIGGADAAEHGPEQVAESLCMGYSNFRKLFKEYTGTTSNICDSKFLNLIRSLSIAKKYHGLFNHILNYFRRSRYNRSINTIFLFSELNLIPIKNKLFGKEHLVNFAEHIWFNNIEHKWTLRIV